MTEIMEDSKKLKPANTNESQSRLRAHGGFGPHYFFLRFLQGTKLMDKTYGQKKQVQKKKKKYKKKEKKGTKKIKKGQNKKGQNKKYYILSSPPSNMEEHLHDNSTTDERPFSDEAGKTLRRGIRMIIEEIVDSSYLGILNAHDGIIDDIQGQVDSNSDAIIDIHNNITDIENDIHSIQEDVSMLMDNEVSQNNLDDIRRELDVLKAAIANMLSSMADNAANVSTEYLWALKNTGEQRYDH